MKIAIIGQQDFGKAVLEAFLARGDTVAGVFVAPEKEGAKPDRVMQELSKYNLVPEEWGGKTIYVQISAKKKLGLDKLLEMLLLEADLLELKADPNNAAAEYVLGELARQAREFPEAAEHFSRAAKLDPTFVDAFIGLGKSLVAAGQTPEAVAPLEAAVKLEPENPVALYQLAYAYRRVGRTQDADRELEVYRQTNERARKNLQDIRAAVTGRMTPAQTAEPPE